MPKPATPKASCSWLPGGLSLLSSSLFAIPMIIAIYFGAEAVGNFITQLPEWITNALNATGKLLPALGFAMTINVIGRPRFCPSSWAASSLLSTPASAAFRWH